MGSGLGLVMLVKDEARRVGAALAPLRDVVDELVVVDTGSADSTLAVLAQLGIPARHDRLDPTRCGALADARNRALATLSTPWALSLDADERLEPEGLRKLCAHVAELPDDVGGVGVRWRTHTPEGAFDDYKVAFFRRGVRKVGFIHDHVQADLRRLGLRAVWSDEVVLEHHPEPRKDGAKAVRYAERLACARRCDPHSPRYPWFRGYMALRAGDLPTAVRDLSEAARARHPWWPIESLNAGMALAEAHARRGDRAACLAALHAARVRLRELEGDWELAMNPGHGPWVVEALAGACAGRLERVRLPRFAC